MTTQQMTEAALDREIEEARKRVADLQKEKERRSHLPEDQKLAEHLHAKQCGWDHNDRCGWFYEETASGPNWNGHAHNRYLTIARKALENHDYNTIVGVLEAIEK